MYPRHPWPAQFTRGELFRGWVFFALYLTVFPGVMGAVQQLTGSELPVAETNVLYYLLCAALLFLLLWTFLRQSFDRLLDRLAENLLAAAVGLAAAAALRFLVGLIPLPVQNPNTMSYPEEFVLSPAATAVILVLLMPVVEEILFRGLIFGNLRRYSRGLAYGLAVPVYAVYCVWQFVYAYGVIDWRYLLLALEYLPMSAALCWCYERGQSIWSAVLLHMALNGVTLYTSLAL